MIRQVWQGWWEIVNVDTGHVLCRRWQEKDIRECSSKFGM